MRMANRKTIVKKLPAVETLGKFYSLFMQGLILGLCSYILMRGISAMIFVLKISLVSVTEVRVIAEISTSR